MIPIQHDPVLTPYLRLWKKRSGKPGFVGREGDGWWLYLFERTAGAWELVRGTDGEERKFGKVTDLSEWIREDDGEPFLLGAYGLGWYTVGVNQWKPGPPLTLYYSTRPPRRLPTKVNA